MVNKDTLIDVIKYCLVLIFFFRCSFSMAKRSFYKAENGILFWFLSADTRIHFNVFFYITVNRTINSAVGLHPYVLAK